MSNPRILIILKCSLSRITILANAMLGGIKTFVSRSKASFVEQEQKHSIQIISQIKWRVQVAPHCNKNHVTIRHRTQSYFISTLVFNY